jgi:methionine-rich copper-binding protein CopC
VLVKKEPIKIKKVKLFKINGRKVQQWDLKKQRKKMKFKVKNSVKKGLYVVKVKTNKGIFKKKILIE